MEKVYELRRCEVEAMDKITEDLEDAARRHNNKILYWHVYEFKGSSQFKIGMRPQLVIKKELKRDGAKARYSCRKRYR